MRKVIVAMCVLGLLAWAAPAWATDNIWQGDDGTDPNDWFRPANWSLNSVPTTLDGALIEDSAVVNHPLVTGTTAVCQDLRVGTANGNGILNVGGDLTVNWTSGIGGGGVFIGADGGTGLIKQTSGTFGELPPNGTGWFFNMAAEGENSTGTFELEGGTCLVRGQVRMGRYLGSRGFFTQKGGIFNMPSNWSLMEVGMWEGYGEYKISGGKTTIYGLTLGGTRGYAEGGGAKWEIRDTDGTPEITILNALKLGGKGIVGNYTNVTIKADTGSVVHMQGHFYNCMGHYTAALGDPKGVDEEDVDGLNNITLQFEHGGAITDTLEVAGADLGDDYHGLCENYALEGLRVGGNVVGGGYQTGSVMLLDALDNQLDDVDNEVLYVQHLEMGVNAILNLGGRTLYSYTSSIDASATVLNGTHTQLTWIVGDLDLDVDVDWIDYTTLRGNYGTMVGMTWADGDLNGDGAVDWSDYTALRGMYGENACSPAGPGTIPEPATMVLLGLGGIGVLIRRKRK